MNFSILTPHHNQLDYIKRCVKSVRDQLDGTHSSFALTHLIQDSDATGLSERQLRERLGGEKSGPEGYQMKIHCEKDEGMYDALNRAYARSDGEIVGHINCDEQYLPGTLAYVHDRFLKEPDLQVLSGAVVITYPDGSYCCSRKPVKPGYLHTLVCHLSLFTAATFYRRSFLESIGVFFDTRFRAAGDADLFTRILKSKAKIRTTGKYFSLFAETGTNLALSHVAKEERKLRLKEVPPIIVRMQPLIELHHQIKKLVCGVYFLKPFSYEFITNDLQRTHIQVDAPTGIWRDRRRLRLYKHGLFEPHNPLTSCPPGKLSKQAVSFPHVMVISAPRSGTHLMIDAILNNLHAYRRRPLFVELDKLLEDPDDMDRLIQTSGYVIKTHYPVMERGEANPRLTKQMEQLARNAVLVYIQRDPEKTFRSAQRMFPWLNEQEFAHKAEMQQAYWNSFNPVGVCFEELVNREDLDKLLSTLADKTGTPRKSGLSLPPAKNRRKYIYFLKLSTRTLGRFAPQINTGIRLGEPH
ncbi:MAG: glycosyltransferase [Verrucomicrobia bacterium]|nr:glycosyltransferase [Verrucomicrobiota bacterium]MCH8511789.1 glycosyltransferase [Kiritimatiellia bacterium]